MSNPVTPWTVAHQAALPMGYSRQEYWWGCHFLLQQIFLTHICVLCPLHWWVDSLSLHYLGSPSVCVCIYIYRWIIKSMYFYYIYRERSVLKSPNNLPLFPYCLSGVFSPSAF